MHWERHSQHVREFAQVCGIASWRLPCFRAVLPFSLRASAGDRFVVEEEVADGCAALMRDSRAAGLSRWRFFSFCALASCGTKYLKDKVDLEQKPTSM